VIIVDASVAVKWLLWEAESDAALDFLQAHELAAPELIYLEVASALVRRANIDKALHTAALRSLEKWTIAWSDHAVRNVRVTQRRLFHASRLALQLGTPLKNCIYLAIAMEKACDLATCDVRFRDKALPLYRRVRLLSEYAS
jgi:predicted nucleic acid-binding protein